jgi:hypothetical protein
MRGGLWSSLSTSGLLQSGQSASLLGFKRKWNTPRWRVNTASPVNRKPWKKKSPFSIGFRRVNRIVRLLLQKPGLKLVKVFWMFQEAFECLGIRIRGAILALPLTSSVPETIIGLLMMVCSSVW